MGAALRAVLRFLGTVIGAVVDVVGATTNRIFDAAEAWITDAKHAQYGSAVMRMLLGAMIAGTLATNFTTRLYTYGSGAIWNGEAADPRSGLLDIPLFGFFRLAATDDVRFTIGYIALFALAIALLLGWRTKLVIPLLLCGWVGLVEMNDSVSDQSDNATRIVLIVMLFADTAQRWSLDARRRARHLDAANGSLLTRLRYGFPLMPAWFTTIFHNLALVVLALQVIFIYGSGAFYKAAGEPWQNGKAIYAPLATDRFGPWPVLSDLVTASPVILTAAGWGTIILQACFGAMLLHRGTRIVALLGILSFHLAIALLMGLPWFSLAMIAIDALFIRDVTWTALARFVRRSWANARGRSLPADAPALPSPTAPTPS